MSIPSANKVKGRIDLFKNETVSLPSGLRYWTFSVDSFSSCTFLPWIYAPVPAPNNNSAHPDKNREIYTARNKQRVERSNFFIL